MNARWLFAVPITIVAITTCEGRARAQASGFALDRFEPAAKGSNWFVLDSLDLRGSGRPAVGAVVDYAAKPLVLYNADGSERSAIVSSQLFFHLGGSVVLANRIRVAANLPIAGYQNGDGGSLNGQALQSPTKAALGDLRFDVDVRLYGEKGQPLTMAVGAQLFLPTGDQSLFTGDGGVRFAPHVLAAGEAGPFAYAASLGFMVHAQDSAFAGNPIGGELLLAGAAGVLLADRHLLVGPELYGRTDVTDSGTAFARQQSPFEALLGGHYRLESWRIGAGVGAGLAQGFGSPAVRVVGSVEFAPRPAKAVADRDNDGIPDDEDACPDQAGVRTDDPQTNGCPPAGPVTDRDNDGVPDNEDACPDVPGVRMSDPKTNGCPPDSDHDGIPDADDACPDVPGIKTDDPATNGCPKATPADPDRDKDGILNEQDACPDTAGDPDPDPKKNGCPKAVVQQGQIRILDQVKFKSGSAVILPDSDIILNAVRKILVDHPEIKKVSIEGHTDNHGGVAFNKTLSEGRAASVVQWLTAHGIEKDRLSSVGYGQSRPIDTNATEDGRQTNRRVEFHIVDDANAAPPPAP